MAWGIESFSIWYPSERQKRLYLSEKNHHSPNPEKGNCANLPPGKIIPWDIETPGKII